MKHCAHVAFSLALLALLSGRAVAQLVSGGGESLLAGGYGFPPIPVKTNFAFDIDMNAEGEITGHFECLALTPSQPAGSGSGLFTDNVMYVTGRITRLEVASSGKIVFGGTATVTGLGAGLDLPFDCDVSTGPKGSKEGGSGIGITPGGPGATMTLSISGLTFYEIVTNGAIRVDEKRLKLMRQLENFEKLRPRRRP